MKHWGFIASLSSLLGVSGDSDIAPPESVVPLTVEAHITQLKNGTLCAVQPMLHKDHVPLGCSCGFENLRLMEEACARGVAPPLGRLEDCAHLPCEVCCTLRLDPETHAQRLPRPVICRRKCPRSGHVHDVSQSSNKVLAHIVQEFLDLYYAVPTKNQGVALHPELHYQTLKQHHAIEELHGRLSDKSQDLHTHYSNRRLPEPKGGKKRAEMRENCLSASAASQKAIDALAESHEETGEVPSPFSE